MVKEAGPTRIRSVRRAATLLEHVALSRGGCTATAAAGALDIPVPTAYHLLNTLVDAGLLAKDERRRYQLGARVGLLAEAFLAQVSAPAYLVDRLRELADRTGETAYLSAWRGSDAVLLQIVEGRRAVRVSGLHLGYSGIAHARASGKVLLAYGRPGTLEEYLATHRISARTSKTVSGAEALRAEIEQARRMGYAVDEEEFAEGVACIAAPVADGTMAIGISVPVERYRSLRQELIDVVVAVAGSAAAPQMHAAGEA
jgi:IclR family transcriptional regulator, acetate operon repressor